MTRAKYERKSTKRPAKTEVGVTVVVLAPHTTTTVSFDFDKVATKKWPSLLKQLAKLIETGELKKELEKAFGDLGVDASMLRL